VAAAAYVLSGFGDPRYTSILLGVVTGKIREQKRLRYAVLTAEGGE
jgi:hypothetical protein